MKAEKGDVKVITGHAAAAHGARLCRPDVATSYPITPMSEVAETRAQVTSMSFKDARMRLATFVLSLVSAGEAEPARSCSLNLPLTSQEIAEILELSPETVSRTWHALRQEGLIEKRGRHLVIQNLRALEATARR